MPFKDKAVRAAYHKEYWLNYVASKKAEGLEWSTEQREKYRRYRERNVTKRSEADKEYRKRNLAKRRETDRARNRIVRGKKPLYGLWKDLRSPRDPDTLRDAIKRLSDILTFLCEESKRV